MNVNNLKKKSGWLFYILGVNEFEQEPTDSSSESNIKNRASAKANINFLEKACSSASTKTSLDKNVKDGATILIIAQTVNFQYGDNNCLNAISNAEYDGTTADTECGEQYEVCLENDVSKILDNNENLENTMNNDSVQYSTLPAEPTTSQNVNPQFSSSSSDSQDGNRPDICCPNETAEHTSEKLVFQERNGDKMVFLASTDNISSHDNTNTISESHGHSEIRDVIFLEEFGVALRQRDEKYEEDEEEQEETELKELINKSHSSVLM